MLGQDVEYVGRQQMWTREKKKVGLQGRETGILHSITTNTKHKHRGEEGQKAKAKRKAGLCLASRWVRWAHAFFC